ncbi:MAG: hypothetical protein Q8J76_14375 [Desulfobulbaceae bacterium]|nr:hypothetical protein [Desulfobulbaceae bacterium]
MFRHIIIIPLNHNGWEFADIAVFVAMTVGAFHVALYVMVCSESSLLAGHGLLGL